MNSVNPFDVLYAIALDKILCAPVDTNFRTGKKVRAVHGVNFALVPGQLPLLTLRDIKPMWTCAEVVWFLRGDPSAAFMEKYGFKVWSKFADESGFVRSATGYRWRKAFGVDQVWNVIDKLRRDVSSRQCVLLSWDPRLDAERPGPNAPCVMIWHVHVIGQELHMSVLQRSADMYFGLPHDILGSRLIQEILAAYLGLHAGGLMYSISNAHLYEDQWGPAEEMLRRAESVPTATLCGPDFGLTAANFQNIMMPPGPDDRAVEDLFENVMSIYKPWPPIAGPKLVV